MISLSTRGLTATAAMVVTVPSASSRTGTNCLTALAAVTPTNRWSPRDACAAAFCDDEPFQKKTPIPARTSPAAAPAIHVRFFMRAVGPALKPVSRTPSFRRGGFGPRLPPVLQRPVAHCRTGLHARPRGEHREPEF